VGCRVRGGWWTVCAADQLPHARKAVFKVNELEFRIGGGETGAQSLVPPSIHPKGGRYDWLPGLSPDDVAFAVLPDAVLAQISVDSVSSPDDRKARESAKQNLTPCERARRYVAKMPPAISGHRGHDATIAVACVLKRDFGLSDSDALAVLREYNQRCEPPWSEAELQHKLTDARIKALEEPHRIGEKLKSNPHQQASKVTADTSPGEPPDDKTPAGKLDPMIVARRFVSDEATHNDTLTCSTLVLSASMRLITGGSGAAGANVATSRPSIFAAVSSRSCNADSSW